MLRLSLLSVNMNTPIPNIHTLIDIFNLFKQRGDTPAFIYRTGVRRFEYTYNWLYEQSLRMNAFLESQHIEPGDRVVLWAPNSPWWAVAYWGIISRGAMVVPVDFMSDKTRAQSIAELSGAKLVIQSRYKLEGLRNDDSGLVCINIEELEHIVSSFKPHTLDNNPAPEDTVELVYTSGTTGNPKGVMLSHKNLITNIKQGCSHIHINADFRFLSVLPLSHMFEQMGGFLIPLAVGCTVIYVRTLKPSSIMDALHEEDITLMMIVPRLLQALKSAIEREMGNKRLDKIFNKLITASEGWSPRKRKIIFKPIAKKFGSHFKFFVSGGAALDTATAKFWKYIGFTVIEGYGLTETSPLLALNTLEKQIIGSVGQPVQGVHITLREKELLAKGDNIFSGYYNNEEATQNAFTEDGWFVTGDLGEVDQDGNIYIKGRRKEMIVTGSGVNVFPDDIEPVLNSIKGVSESCVIGLDRGQGEEVHAVIILSPHAQGEKQEEVERIVEQANARLDSAQQITGFTIWNEPEFPKTTTLKIKKFEVKKKIQSSSDATTSAAHDLLTSLIAKATNKPVSDIHDASRLVADLGLTSIARLELVSFIEQEFRLDMEDTAITQHTTVQELRAMIKKRETLTSHDHLRAWTNTIPVKLFRIIIDNIIQRPLFRVLVTTHIKNRSIVENLKDPVIFIVNHVSFIDHLGVMAALPARVRYNTATASREEMYFPAHPLLKIFGRIMFEYVTLVNNVFMLPQTRGFKRSLTFMGKLIDRRINILIYPEGERTTTRELLPFKTGIGIMIHELKVPVVPMYLKGFEEVYPRGALFPKRGHVTITFGDPLTFTNETPEEITDKCKQAILNLRT